MGKKGRAKWNEDRNKRRRTKGPNINSNKKRERNVGHPNAEEHNRKGKRK